MDIFFPELEMTDCNHKFTDKFKVELTTGDLHGKWCKECGLFIPNDKTVGQFYATGPPGVIITYCGPK
jgi:hypothetical protein